MSNRYTLGLDFGTESVRAVLVDVANGAIAAQAAERYPHGVIDQVLPTGGPPLPPDYALQHPDDWISAMARACRETLTRSSVSADTVIGIGVAFTSCTMLPTRADGTPLCLGESFAKTPLAWPRLWKHHGAKTQTDRINQVAAERNEPWLKRYGGVIGLEWFFPKVLEALEDAPQVFDAADVWLEAGDWLVWRLAGGPLIRSTCQAGYKAMWNAQSGYPSRAYLAAVHPKLPAVLEKLPGKHQAPGTSAGGLSPAMAQQLGLKAATPVAAAIIDAHAGVPGAGVGEPDTMVLVMGTSSCHMMNSTVEALVPGVAGVVAEGILPGYFGYETGQASVGDAFAWVCSLVRLDHAELNRRAAALAPGSGGVIALDWLNGCRTPLMDGRLSGALVGLTLNTRPEQIYRAMLEATALGLRWIVQCLRDGQVPVRRFVASGGLPDHSPLLMQIYADVLGEAITLAESSQSVALGAAILGCLAAGEKSSGHADVHAAIAAMARQRPDLVYRPDTARHQQYDALYDLYRTLAAPDGPIAQTMRRLRTKG